METVCAGLCVCVCVCVCVRIQCWQEVTRLRTRHMPLLSEIVRFDVSGWNCHQYSRCHHRGVHAVTEDHLSHT